MAIALYFLKGVSDYETNAELFCIGHSTVGIIVSQFCPVVIKIYKRKMMKFPSKGVKKGFLISILENGFIIFVLAYLMLLTSLF